MFNGKLVFPSISVLGTKALVSSSDVSNLLMYNIYHHLGKY